MWDLLYLTPLLMAVVLSVLGWWLVDVEDVADEEHD